MRIGMIGCLLVLAACHRPDADDNRSTGTPAPSGNAVAPTPSPAGSVPLVRFVGKYPFDKVGGNTFLGRPEVRLAAQASGADADVRGWIFDRAGPQTPIVLRAGRLLSWGCEAHNCGDHNWTILITQNGSDAEICYHDGTAKPATTWYADGKREDRTDECPSGDAN